MKKKMGNNCLMMVLSVEEKGKRSELPMRLLQGRELRVKAYSGFAADARTAIAAETVKIPTLLL